MSEVEVELLSQERAIAMWPEIAPLVEQSITGNVVSMTDMDAQYVFNALCSDELVVFGGFEENKLICVLAIQFSEANGHKCADIVALGGRRLTSFKRLYWEPILKWLRANGVEFLDSFVPLDRAMVYTNKFGFDKACAHIRMSLGN